MHILFYLIIITTNIGFWWNPTESIGIELEFTFHWNSMYSNGNHSGRPPGSDHFHWIPSDSIGISIELKTKMAEAPANWFLLELHAIPTFWLESSGFHWNSWERVKTSALRVLDNSLSFRTWNSEDCMENLHDNMIILTQG